MDLIAQSVVERCKDAISDLQDCAPEDRIDALNEIRKALHEVSPFRSEPVDCVLWVRAEDVEANDYNPNNVAPPEMDLLETSIEHDGFTQPIVTWVEDGTREVIDGFHRNLVAQDESRSVRERLKGYVPVTTANADRTDRGDRMAATIRHNRARGQHQVGDMSDIVVELKKRNWSDEKIAEELGMDPDEVLRLKQVRGLAAAFEDEDFSTAWEAVSE